MELTKAERRFIYRTLEYTKYDLLWSRACSLLPCSIIAGLGIYDDSAGGALSGLLAYLIIEAYVLYRNIKTFPVLQGICTKLVSVVDESGSDSK